MTVIDPETSKLVLGWKHVFTTLGGMAAIAGILGVVGWNVLKDSLTEVRDGLKGVREDVKNLGGADLTSVTKNAQTEISLRDLIGNLDKNVAIMRGDLASFTKSTDMQLQIINANFSDMRDNWETTSTAVTAISARLLRIEESIGVSPSPQENNTPAPAPKFDQAPTPELGPVDKLFHP